MVVAKSFTPPVRYLKYPQFVPRRDKQIGGNDLREDHEMPFDVHRPLCLYGKVNYVAALMYSLIVAFATLYLYLHTLPLPLAKLQVLDTTVAVIQSDVTYLGKSTHGVESFLNIRFAEATGLKNRFRAPKPYSYPPNAQVEARFPGAACPQHRVPISGIPEFDEVTTVSEDCLTLRIDRPTGTRKNERLPILVWIYGGGNSVGQIYDSAYDPTRLVHGAYDKDTAIIYVAMNYRLGIFGFSAFEGLDSDLNIGLLDQRLALEWIQANIEYFGGDPQRVTIFGESAGGIAVGLHLTAYGQATNDARLFQRAIMQSGGSTSHFGTVATSNYQHTSAISQLLGCTGEISALECLQDWPLEELLAVSVNYSLTLNPFGGIGVWGPNTPSPFIPDAPSELLQSGRFARDVDIIIGWNEDDGSIFTPPPELFAEPSFLARWIHTKYQTSNSSLVNEILRLYSSTSFKDKQSRHLDVPPDWFRASQIIRDMSYACPALLVIQASRQHSPGTHVSEPLATIGPRRYLYELNATLYGPVEAERNLSYLGVIHFADIAFIFNQASSSAYNATKAQLDLADQISGSWATFAQTGSVVATNASNSLQNWPKAVQDSPITNDLTVRLLGSESDGLVQIGNTLDDFENLQERCAFWNRMDILKLVGV